MSRPVVSLARTLHNAAGLTIDVNANGSIRRMDCHGVMLNLFLGNEVEGGPANLWLRRHGAGAVEAVPLLGPVGPLQPLRPQAAPPPDHTVHDASGEWQGLSLRLQLRLAASEPAALNTTS